MVRVLALAVLLSAVMAGPAFADADRFTPPRHRICSVPGASGTRIEIALCLAEVAWPEDITTVDSPRFKASRVVPMPPTARTYSVHGSKDGLYIQECWGYKGITTGFFLPTKYATDPNWGPAYSRFLAEAKLGDPPGCGKPKERTR